MTAKKNQPSWSFEKDFNFPESKESEVLSFPMNLISKNEKKLSKEQVYQFTGKDKLRKIQALIESRNDLTIQKFAVITNDYKSFVIKIVCEPNEIFLQADGEIKSIIDGSYQEEVKEEIFHQKSEDILSSLDFHLKVKDDEGRKAKEKKLDDEDDKKNEYFFKISNHQDFYKVGNSYYEDFKLGIKSFSFYGVGANNTAYDTVIGVTAFINYYEKKSALIISNSMKNELKFEDGWKEIEKEFSTPSMDKFKIHFFQMGKMFVMNYDELMILRSKLSGTSFQVFLEEFSDLFNLVVWELPTLDEMSQQNEFFFPLCISIESVSLILTLGENRSREVEKTVSFFQKYGVKIKGFLLDRPEDLVEN